MTRRRFFSPNLQLRVSHHAGLHNRRAVDPPVGTYFCLSDKPQFFQRLRTVRKTDVSPFLGLGMKAAGFTAVEL